MYTLWRSSLQVLDFVVLNLKPRNPRSYSSASYQTKLNAPKTSNSTTSTILFHPSPVFEPWFSDIECALLRPLSFSPGNIIISYSTLSQLNISHMVLKNLLWPPSKKCVNLLVRLFLAKIPLEGEAYEKSRTWEQIIPLVVTGKQDK